MRKPAEAPGWQQVWQELSAVDKSGVPNIARLLQNTEFAALVRRANDGYVHWHKLRYLPMPEGITPLQVWAGAKMARISQRQALPLSLYAMGQQIGYWIPPQHQEWLHEIDKKAGGTISSSIADVPEDNDRYLFNSLMEEAIASSRLEGAATTREKAKKLLRTARRPRTRSEQMIVNNYNAILEIRDAKSEQLTPEFLCHIQEVLTKDTLDDASAAGRFRVNADQVRVEDSVTQEVLHYPPDADTIKERLDELCAFANQKSKPFIHPVIKAIALHFTIGFVHPFVDGNGRTARAIFYWYMLKRGYWLFEYLPLSRILIKAPSQYERAYLYTEDEGDLTYFTHFNLRTILQALRDLYDYIGRQQAELREATKLLDAYPGLNHRQAGIITQALKHQNRRFLIQQHAGMYHISYATARADLLGLEQAGLLQKVEDGKRLVFYATEDMLTSLRSSKRARVVAAPGTEQHEAKVQAVTVTKQPPDEKLLF